MNDIYTKIQVLFIKKDRECGQLRFLTSRTTVENLHHISDLCNAVNEIFKDAVIKTGDNSSKTDQDCVQCYKYLLLNTNFKAQEFLCEDIINGHLVDMCPPLSPYLFLELIWSLEYEEILAESLLYIPLDLCIEILDIARRCVELLDPERSLNTLVMLIEATYKKFMLMQQDGTQTFDKEESLTRIMASVQELMSLLDKSKVTDTSTLRELEKYERFGVVLKRVLRLSRNCFEFCNIGVTKVEEMEKMYKVTFGREHLVAFDQDSLEEQMDEFNKELVNLVLKLIKKVDCNIYLGWVELNDIEDPSLSLQRAIGIDCYLLVQSVNVNGKLMEYNHLIECLQQLSVKPDSEIPPSAMSLEALCDRADQGHKACLRELSTRYKEWDAMVLSCFERNYSSMDKNDCLQLLDSLIQLNEHADREDYRKKAYATVMKALLLLRLTDHFEVVLKFILKYDAQNVLESGSFEADFNSFITRNLTLCSDKNSLRTILFFVIQNPKTVLRAILEITIGASERSNAMIMPKDLFKLSPIMQILDANGESLLTNAFRNACNGSTAWNAKKFADLVQSILEKRLLTADDVMNKIFIPCLQNIIAVPNFLSVLNCMRIVRTKCTRKLHVTSLFQVLARKLTELRKNVDLSKYQSGEVLGSLIRMIEYFVNQQFNRLEELSRGSLIEELEKFLEPIDKIYFVPLWFSSPKEFHIDRVLQEYEKRCLLVANKLAVNENTRINEKNCLARYGIDSEDLLRHLILRCTEAEYMRFAAEATIFHWDFFGWTSETHAYSKFSLATADVCNYCLEFPSNSSLETFPILIKYLAQFSRWFVSIDAVNDYEGIHNALVKTIKSLEESLNNSNYAEFQESLSTSIHQTASGGFSFQTISDMIERIHALGDAFSCQCQHYCDKPASLRAKKFHIKNEFVSACLSYQLRGTDTLACKMDRKLFSVHNANI